MSDLLLSEAERRRFARWCTHEATTLRGLIEQMLRVGVPAAFIDAKTQEARAFMTVAKVLDSIHEG